MNTADTEYCVICGDQRHVRHETRQTEFEVRGETLVLDLPVKVCGSCGTVEEEEGIDPAEIAFAQFRRCRGLLTPEEIRAIRKNYRLSQRSLAAVLGMSEATINRYEGGGLQDEAHDQAIRACQNPEVMRDLLKRRGDRLSEWQRGKVEQALEGEEEEPRGFTFDLSGLWNMPNELSLTTGFREFSYRRYAAVVAWFCQRLKTITPTSLNKLLFYADFLCFRSESVSLTGAAYRRLDYGPVPADFGRLREQMEWDQFVEVREVRWRNGNVGEEYRGGPKADEIGVAFSPRELKVLEAVAKSFEGVSPGEISDRSHQESAWRETEERALISYEKATDLSLCVPD